MLDKCEGCLNGRAVISENGSHYVCSLKDKRAVACLLGTKDEFVSAETLLKDLDAATTMKEYKYE